MPPRKEGRRERNSRRRCCSHHPIYTWEGTSRCASPKATVSQPKTPLDPSDHLQAAQNSPCSFCLWFPLGPWCKKALAHTSTPCKPSAMEFGYQKSIRCIVSVFKTNSCNFFSFLGLRHNCILKLVLLPLPTARHMAQGVPQLFPSPASHGFDLFRMQFSVLSRHQRVIIVELRMVYQAKKPSPIQHSASLPFGGDSSMCLVHGEHQPLPSWTQQHPLS